MDVFIHWAGFAGAWLLVAGPLFQASVELRDEQFDSDVFEEAVGSVSRPGPVSPWWWMLPPVAYAKNIGRSRIHREDMLRALTPEQRERVVGFMNKANGWIFVAGGAFLIALKETWELVHLYHLPALAYWAVVLLMTVIAFSNTVIRTMRAERQIHVDDPGYQARRRIERARAIADRRARRGDLARPQRTKSKPPAGDA